MEKQDRVMAFPCVTQTLCLRPRTETKPGSRDSQKPRPSTLAFRLFFQIFISFKHSSIILKDLSISLHI